MKIIFYFLSSRIMFLLFAVFASLILPLREGYLGKSLGLSNQYLAWIWANFDGVHFLDIASKGYNNFDFAFFPLYPLLVSFLSKIFHLSELTTGILLSLICLILSLFLVYKIVTVDFKEKVARLTILLLLFSPYAFFYHSVYTESLFLLTTTASLYFARRKHWIWSGIFGMLAILTRLAGVSLIPALCAEWYIQNRKGLQINSKTFLDFFSGVGLAILICGLGLVFYMMYLKFFFGDALLFQKSMVAWNQSSFVLLPQVIFRYFRIFLNVEPLNLVYSIAILEFLSFFLYLWLSIYTLFKIRLSYGIYMIVLLILVTFTGTFAGTPRYITHLFPAFLALAVIVDDNKFLRFEIAVFYLLLGFTLTTLFTRGNFIT